MHRRIAMLAGTVAAVALLLVLAGCATTTDRGNGHPQRWPLGLPATVVSACEQSVGLGNSSVAPTFYRDSQGVHVLIGHRNGNGNRIPIGSGGGVSNTESALLSCLNVASGPLPSYPTDSASLILLWKYSSTVLWPCIAQHSIDPGQAPSRADIVTGDPLVVDPYARLYSRISHAQMAQLRRDCPAVPPYLTSVTP